MTTPGLPSSSTVKKLAVSMNSKFDISPCPNGIIEVQQSLRVCIAFHIKSLSEKTKKNSDLPSTIKVKLTADGTRIARELNVVNFAFTILEEGAKAQSVVGNHTIAIMKVSSGLKDICQEARDLDVITIDEKVYKITFFLATVNGLESANADFACIWCKCAKTQHFNMNLQWSNNDVKKELEPLKKFQKRPSYQREVKTDTVVAGSPYSLSSPLIMSS